MHEVLGLGFVEVAMEGKQNMRVWQRNLEPVFLFFLKEKLVPNFVAKPSYFLSKKEKGGVKIEKKVWIVLVIF